MPEDWSSSLPEESIVSLGDDEDKDDKGDDDEEEEDEEEDEDEDEDEIDVGVTDPGTKRDDVNEDESFFLITG